MKASESLKQLYNLLGEDIFIVGGYVRNSLLGLLGGDIDIAGQILPEKLADIIRGSQFIFSNMSKKLGTIKITDTETCEEFEYTCFRSEKYQSGGLHTPCEVKLGVSILDDAKRRDFSCNSVYFSVAKNEYIDPTERGIPDIKKRLLRCVIDADKVFASDGLRILRMVRQSAELGFEIDSDTFKKAIKNIDKLTDISAERIHDELLLILKADTKYGVADAHYIGITRLYEVGAFKIFMPEMLENESVSQRADFHKYDVLNHIFMSVKYAAPPVRLAALMHDISKGHLKKQNGNMHGHDSVGESMTREILSRLKFSNAEIDRCARLVGLHMKDLDGRMKESKIRIVILKNLDIFEDLMLLKQADYLGCGLMSGECPASIKWRKIYAEMLRQNVPLSRSHLKIDIPQMVGEYSLVGGDIAKIIDRILCQAVKCGIDRDNTAAIQQVKKEVLSQWIS